jgi:imidazole glycerol-phosphate synthase subunit HisH
MIGIIDYEIGNLRSVERAIERVGGEAKLIRTPEEIAASDKIILPGVAAFADAMEELRDRGLVEPLVESISSGKPYLGFCLGLQLLFEVSEEDGVHEGLGVLPGRVIRFDFGADSDRAVPHMGWNQIRFDGSVPMLEGLENDTYVYFAHSYHVVPEDKSIIATTTDYGFEFVSAVWKDNVFATQFHPEKSQAIGLRLLENFVRL